MITKLDIGPFERPVAFVWVPIRLEQRAVTSPVTSPQKPKPEFETIPTELSRLGYTCLDAAELTQESSWSRAPNLKIWARRSKWSKVMIFPVQASFDPCLSGCGNLEF